MDLSAPNLKQLKVKTALKQEIKSFLEVSDTLTTLCRKQLLSLEDIK